MQRTEKGVGSVVYCSAKIATPGFTSVPFKPLSDYKYGFTTVPFKPLSK